ncbi:MAG: DoxX family protein [Planctomyces sp.]
MSPSEQQPIANANRKLVWTGRVISGLLALAFGMSGLMKLKGGAEFAEGTAKLGLPESIRIPLAILELTCLAFYLFPPTSVIGAILLTGYMGGAICTHWRVGDPFPVHIVIGVLIWLGVCLREPRLWAVMPWRRR